MVLPNSGQTHRQKCQVMNKSTECIWHPIIWSCCPLLPLMILRYKCPRVLCSPGCMLSAQNSVKNACLHVNSSAVCLHHAVLTCKTAGGCNGVCMVLRECKHGTTFCASLPSQCQLPHYDELAAWFQLGWVVIKSSLPLLVSPALHRLPRNSISLHFRKKSLTESGHPQPQTDHS